MKTKSFLRLVRSFLITLVGCLLTAGVPAADDINTLFQQGRTAYLDGNFDLAQKLLSQVHSMNPRHMEANAMLADIAVQTKKGEGNLRKQYDGVIIPKFTVADASLQECLEALTLIGKNASGGKVSPNFVVKTPSLNKTTITLNLSNVPLTEAIRYVAELSKAKTTWDKHAVMFSGAAD